MKKQKTAQLRCQVVNLTTGEILASGSTDCYISEPRLDHLPLKQCMANFIGTFTSFSHIHPTDNLRLQFDFVRISPEPTIPEFTLDVY